MSAEGLEAGNKQLRFLREHRTTRGDNYEGMKGSLKHAWLVSSPLIRRTAKVTTRKYSCSVCGRKGHNKLTCVQSQLE